MALEVGNKYIFPLWHKQIMDILENPNSPQHTFILCHNDNGLSRFLKFLHGTYPETYPVMFINADGCGDCGEFHKICRNYPNRTATVIMVVAGVVQSMNSGSWNMFTHSTNDSNDTHIVRGLDSKNKPQSSPKTLLIAHEIPDLPFYILNRFSYYIIKDDGLHKYEYKSII